MLLILLHLLHGGQVHSGGRAGGHGGPHHAVVLLYLHSVLLLLLLLLRGELRLQQSDLGDGDSLSGKLL